MLGRLHVLAIHQQFLIELLAGPESHELDFNIAPRFESREPDHVLSKIGDSDRVAHVEVKDVAAPACSRGLKHELYRFRNGHEEADDLGMGDGHRSTHFNLALKDRHNAAATAEHVAKPHCCELGRATAHRQ